MEEMLVKEMQDLAKMLVQNMKREKTGKGNVFNKPVAEQQVNNLVEIAELMDAAVGVKVDFKQLVAEEWVNSFN